MSPTPIMPVSEESVIGLEENSERSKTAAFDHNNSCHKSGNVLRLDVPLPFFLQNDVFSKFGSASYSWESNELMTLFVGNQDTGGRVNTNAAPISTKTSSEVEYSIGGCPLECPFDLNEDFDEALVIDNIPTVFSTVRIPTNFSPMQINDARWALKQVITQQEPFVQEMNLVKTSSGCHMEQAPVFAFVDCSDQDRQLVLTGFKSKKETAPVFNVYVMGRFKPDTDILDMQTFRAYHDMNIFTFDNRHMTSVVHSIYEKLHGEYASRGKVYLEFLFKHPTNIFEPPPEDSQSKLAIRPLPGDANPSMKSLWNEIEDLERWIQMLASCNEMGLGAADVTSFLNSTGYDMVENSNATESVRAVQELLAKEPAVDFFSSSSTEISDSLDMVLQRVVQQERTDVDFTDRIWSVVRRCENIDELRECILLVFQSVANKMYRPYLLLTNSTTMAKNLTMVMKGEMGSVLQMRQPETMMKVLIECGLHKLFKDYNFALAMSHLIERGEIDSFSPSISDISLSLNNLKKLHCILEVMCLSKERLTLSVNIQEGHVKKMLKQFSEPASSAQFDWDQTYHFDVIPNDIRRAMTGLHPFYYKVKMESQTFLKWATTTVVVSTEQYINYKRNANDDIHSRLYYVYLICQSGRLENNDKLQ